MKRQLIVVLLAILIAGLCASPVFAQATGTVKGVCKDQQGKPIAGATVEYLSLDTGRKYTLKTNNRGEFFSLGISPGKYKVTLSKDGQEIYHFSGVNVGLDEDANKLDFDMAKEQQAKVQKENLNVKALNEKLALARQDMTAGSYDQAVQVMTEATQVDPNRDLIWFTLGDAYSGNGKKIETTDRAAAKQQYEQAIAAYQKAIAIKPTADYYNNLGQAQTKAGQVDEAIKSYNQAATLDPTRAAMFYFNLGAVLTNTGKVDDAIDAFKKSIAADPNRADSYYWLGVNMIGKATLQGDKMVAPEGTADAFNKYLELQPTGQFAQPAKDMLASIGSSVQTSFGKKKSSKTK
jgi:tetratricopeptide (TPR) repeat protein